MSLYVTCNVCGRVHFSMPLEDAQANIDEFNQYFNTLTASQQRDFGGPSTIHQYLRCYGCGGSYENFRDYVEGDCPVGCTIGPILERTEVDKLNAFNTIECVSDKIHGK